MKLIVSTETYRLLQEGGPAAAEVSQMLRTAQQENAPLEGDPVLRVIERAVCPPTHAWGHPEGDETGFLLDLTTGKKVNLFLCGSFWSGGAEFPPAPEIVFKMDSAGENLRLPPGAGDLSPGGESGVEKAL